MTAYQFSFEKLEVWQLARVLTKEIYRHTAGFPNEEKFLLVSQLRRAAVSVASNLAEGSTRVSAKDKAHFTTISYSSLMEVLNQLIIAEDLGYLTGETIINMRKAIQILSVKLSNLKTSQLKNMSKLSLLIWTLFMPGLVQKLTPLQ